MQTTLANTQSTTKLATNPFALVLLGGGARAAYQAGVLQAIGQILKNTTLDTTTTANRFLFPTLIGTSAGALNAAFLACHASKGTQAFDELVDFWLQLHTHDVYRIDLGRGLLSSKYVQRSRVLAALGIALQARTSDSILNNLVLADTLHRHIHLPNIDAALNNKVLDTLAITASSYSSGAHWTFCQTRQTPSQTQLREWLQPGRRVEFQPITIEHLMASSAIPFIFPATPLWVDGHREYFGDGSMRQMSPLAPAVHMGARKILAIGVGQMQSLPQHSDISKPFAHDEKKNIPLLPIMAKRPTFGVIAAHAMASVFHDTLQTDVAQLRRLSQIACKQPTPIENGEAPPFHIEILTLQPSRSLDDVAEEFIHCLPYTARDTLVGLGAHKGRGAALASYLLFEPDFAKALIALGKNDVQTRRSEILEFFNH